MPNFFRAENLKNQKIREYGLKFILGVVTLTTLLGAIEDVQLAARYWVTFHRLQLQSVDVYKSIAQAIFFCIAVPLPSLLVLSVREIKHLKKM